MNLLKHFQKSSEIKKGKFIFYLDVDPEDEAAYIETELARLHGRKPQTDDPSRITLARALTIQAEALSVLGRASSALKRRGKEKK